MAWWNRQKRDITDIGLAFELAIAAATSTPHKVPAAYRAMQLLSHLAGALPLQEVDDEGIVRDEIAPVLRQPDPDITYHEFMVATVLSLLEDGNAFLYALGPRRRGIIPGVTLLPASEVNVMWADGTHFSRAYEWRGFEMQPGEQIFHISLSRRPGELRGEGPVAAGAALIATARAEQIFARDLMLQHGQLPGYLKIAPPISRAEAQEILDAWQARDKGRPAVLGGDTEWKQMSINPVDAQWIESRNFTVQEIARLFGVPGIFLGAAAGDSLTYSTTETMARFLINSTLNPVILEPIQQTFGLLLPRGRNVRFDTAEILRADQKARIDALAAAVASGIMSVDEARIEEGLPPGGGGEPVTGEM